MPDREKVINGLREMSCRATWKDIDRIRHKFQPIINDAVVLLKKQEADIKNLNETFQNLIQKVTEMKIFYGDCEYAYELVRCKDCKHRPKKPDWATYEDGNDIEFPDGSKCPCQCSPDRYYSWYPDDDWFCADGERMDT